MKLAVVLAACASVVAAVAVPVAEPGTGFYCCCKDSSNKNVWIEGSGLRTCDQDCKGKGYDEPHSRHIAIDQPSLNPDLTDFVCAGEADCARMLDK
ncbi:hypothetical protein C8035_v004787 [Colletotrichum spinosum]|uniref:WSC domain-containing protein n=1 Tax=Colletotrichum spinosum TaxID=1347390 RepID=A0A4R8QI23_9PEZI|nr:hypothetical protein C8035_v004787 [Colletotrichum spinosum]